MKFPGSVLQNRFSKYLLTLGMLVVFAFLGTAGTISMTSPIQAECGTKIEQPLNTHALFSDHHISFSAEPFPWAQIAVFLPDFDTYALSPGAVFPTLALRFASFITIIQISHQSTDEHLLLS